MGTIFYFFHFLTFLKVTVTLNGEQGHKPIHFLLFLVTDYLCVKFHDSAIYSSWVHNFAFLGLSTLGGKMAKKGKSRCLWAVSYDLDCCFYRFDPNNDLRPWRLQQKICSMPKNRLFFRSPKSPYNTVFFVNSVFDPTAVENLPTKNCSSDSHKTLQTFTQDTKLVYYEFS